MKKFFLTMGLAAITTIGFGQIDSIILIDENFNEPYDSLNSPYLIPIESFQPSGNYWGGTTCHPEFSIGGVGLDGSSFLSMNSSYSGNGCMGSSCNLDYVCDPELIFTPVMNFTLYDSIIVKFYTSTSIYLGGGYSNIKILTGIDTWILGANWGFVTQTGTPGGWVKQTFVIPDYLMVLDSTQIKLDITDFDAAINIDNFQVIGYSSEPVIEEPLTCDTVYIEQPPIVIYETDVPQECMLDGNGDGVIGLYDLLNLLQWYGNPSPCTIFPQLPPETRFDFIDIPYYNPTHNKNILKILDTSGREVPPNTKGLLLYIYEDGTIEKRMNTFN